MTVVRNPAFGISGATEAIKASLNIEGNRYINIIESRTHDIMEVLNSLVLFSDLSSSNNKDFGKCDIVPSIKCKAVTSNFDQPPSMMNSRLVCFIIESIENWMHTVSSVDVTAKTTGIIVRVLNVKISFFGSYQFKGVPSDIFDDKITSDNNAIQNIGMAVACKAVNFLNGKIEYVDGSKLTLEFSIKS